MVCEPTEGVILLQLPSDHRLPGFVDELDKTVFFKQGHLLWLLLWVFQLAKDVANYAWFGLSISLGECIRRDVEFLFFAKEVVNFAREQLVDEAVVLRIGTEWRWSAEVGRREQLLNLQVLHAHVLICDRVVSVLKRHLLLGDKPIAQFEQLIRPTHRL